MKAQQLNGRRAAVYSVRLTPEQFQYIERAATLESEQAKGREPKGFSEFVRDAALARADELFAKYDPSPSRNGGVSYQRAPRNGGRS